MSKEEDHKIHPALEPTIKGFTRRDFLKAGVFFGGGLVATGVGATGSWSNFSSFQNLLSQKDQILAELDRKFPLTAGQQTNTETAVEVAKQESRLRQALAVEGEKGAEKVITSPDYIRVQLARAEYKNQLDTRNAAAKNALEPIKNEESSVFIKGMGSLFIFYLGLLVGVNGGWKQLKETENNRVNLAKIFTRALDAKFPNWQQNQDFQLTSPQETMLAGRLFLPPVGGKIAPLMDSKLEIMQPTFTVEEQIEKIGKRRREGKLGPVYVLQMTVQGRLPDDFKFAALGLILRSPWITDWKQPFYSAPWGRIAPLVHDGGRVNTNLNPLWKKVWGRTDFLHRIVKVSVSDLEKLEALTTEEKSKLPVDVLAAARQEQLEKERLVQDEEFFQAAALSCHAKNGTAPKQIPENTRRELGEVWQTYASSIKSLLSSLGADGVCQERWLLDKPRRVQNWPGKRYEAEWLPIQEQLINLENARAKHPQLQEAVSNILRDTTGKVYRIIGLAV